jgi:hypothetical protein
MRNPYPGPRPFRKEEYGIFAGREHEISELTSLIVSHQVVLLYAQSGAGKTSIVNAGLANTLAERGIRFLPVSRVGIPVPAEIPLDQVANVYSFSMVGAILPGIADADPRLRATTLVQAFERLPPAADDSGEPVLTVCAIDQFEELFSVYPERWADREKFFVEVAALLEARRDVRILFVLREDSLAAFGQHAAVLPERGRTRYPIERLREDEAISAIRKPLEGTRLSFAPGVAEAVVGDLMKIAVVSPAGAVVAVPGEFVEPVHLQVVCYTLFERLPENTTSVTLETYRRFGDPDDALEGFYQQALDAAKASTGVDEGELREWFEQKLITPAGTRGLVFRDRQSTGDIPNRVVDVLEQRHIVRPEIRSGSRWYELTHDRFIRPIQQSNLKWKSARWSESFEARYGEAIQAAVKRSGVSEQSLRSFLESLSDAEGRRLARPAEGVPEDSLDELVEAGLLRRESADGKVLYTPLHDALAQAIRRANQGWRASNWAEAVTMRELEDRARRWAGSPSEGKASLVLSRSELRKAAVILAAARASGIPSSDLLADFARASRDAVSAVACRWALVMGGLFLIATVLFLVLPLPPAYSRSLPCIGIAGLGAALMAASWGKDDDDVIVMSTPGLVLLLLAAAGTGVVLSRIHSRYVALPVAFFLGCFACPFLLGALTAAVKVPSIKDAIKPLVPASANPVKTGGREP